MRAGQWDVAASLAATEQDPVAPIVVEYLRILNALDGPERPGTAEIASFIAWHPSWPDQALLARRLGEAVADEPDLRVVRGLCASHPQPAPAALARCAEAQGWAGETVKSEASARSAWVSGLAGEAIEADFVARWGGALTRDDDWARFQKIAGDDEAARRQLARLDAPHRRAAEARLAFRHDDPNALAILAAVPESLRGDPALLLDQAKSLRRGRAYEAAAALWTGAGDAAERALPPAAKPPFRAEREMLARKLLAAGDPATALTLADDHELPPEQEGDSLFLAGWILLRRLHNAAGASDRFGALAKSSHAAITQGRAHYWLGRAAEAQGAAVLAASEYRLAAAWPATFYGQAAVAALGEDAAPLIVALRDPATTETQVQALSASELGRAARVLTGWGDVPRARAFVLRLGQLAVSKQDFAAAAALASRFGFADTQVQIARLAGRAGIVLASSGWPQPVSPPPGIVDADLALGLMRQESSFDADIVSPAGAHGLMQLMPQTAASLAKQAGEAAPDLADTGTNMRLGTRYLASLLQSFDGSLPEAIAAYNAGPHRVRDWIAANGPAAGADRDAELDWIELIPFDETRNYVQRVLENTAIYRARHGIVAQPR